MTAEALVRIPLTEPLTEPWISHACQFPADQQANLEDNRGNWAAGLRRRHPYVGRRPEPWSGWCVIPACECECHQAEPGLLGGEVRLDAFES